jgi:hypothetical protein
VRWPGRAGRWFPGDRAGGHLGHRSHGAADARGELVRFQARSGAGGPPAIELDHVHCVPRRRQALTFVQVAAFSPGACKTVGLAYVGSNPTPATNKTPGQTRCRRSSGTRKARGPPSRRLCSGPVWTTPVTTALTCSNIVQSRSCRTQLLQTGSCQAPVLRNRHGTLLAMIAAVRRGTLPLRRSGL